MKELEDAIVAWEEEPILYAPVEKPKVCEWVLTTRGEESPHGRIHVSGQIPVYCQDCGEKVRMRK